MLISVYHAKIIIIRIIYCIVRKYHLKRRDNLKKRLILILTLLVIFCAACIAYYLYPYREKRFTEAFNINRKEITKIELVDYRDTSYGESVIIEGKDKINEFMKLVDSDVVKKEKSNRGKSDHGWSNGIIFYNGNKKSKELEFKTDIEDLEDRNFYEIIKGDLNQNKIEDFIIKKHNEK